jgi:L-malate glycosyltransferase
MGGTAVTQHVRGLLDAGIEVVCVTLSPEVSRPVRARGELLTVLVGPYRPRHRARDVFARERAFLQHAVARSDAELVHAHWTYEHALAALASGLPNVVTVRDWAPTVLRHHPHPYRLVRLGMAASVLARAPHLTVASPYMAARLRRWGRTPTAIIPNAFEDSILRPRTRQLETAEPRVLAANDGFGHRKNVATLLRAWPKVRATSPSATLTLHGHGHGPGGDAERWARQRGLTDGVVFAGSVDHSLLLAAMSDADVFVHPSLEESFGNVLVEAMARGLPLIAGESSGAVPWVVGDVGRLVDVTVEDELAGAIIDLLGDPAARERASRLGLQRARERFSQEATTRAYLRLYEQVLSS